MTASSQDESSVVELETTWKISKDDSLGTSLHDLAKIETITTDQMKRCLDVDSIADVVDLSKFIILERRNDTELCLVKAKSRNYLKRFCLVSDANKIELFTGVSDLCSYWQTVDGVIVSEFIELESQIYRYDIDLPPLVSCLEVKLHSGMESIMMIGLKVTILDRRLRTPTSRIDFNNVQNILNESMMPLSENAKKALEFMKLANERPALPQMGVAGDQLPSFETMMAMFKGGLQVQDSQTEASVNEERRKVDSDFELLKTYLDVRLQEMEERLRGSFERSIEKAILEQNKKLDCILGLLSK